MAHAFIFPGQGSQQVGMGRALAEAFASARQVFAEVDEALGGHLSRTMWEGPENELTLTENAQPALMAVSLAVVRTLETEFGVRVDAARFVAGHSLGEYSALAAAGALELAEAARLLRTRGRAMQQATPIGLGAMAALLGLDYDAAREVAAEAAQGEVCEAANDNAPGQVVVSGHKAAVERAVEIAKERGAKRALMLSVSAPFHCALMGPAAEVMRDALDEAEIGTPRPPLVANVTAGAVKDPEEIRRRLVEQVTGTVRWRESVGFMAGGGVHLFAELGAGKVLAGLVKRSAAGAEAVSAGAPKELEALAARLGQEDA
ncbi:MAG: ACP S-malonyltransferase [Pseudomonadota bacterium]|nr:ACP S-malonyltransferase [Pseudomonadota bacterium]